MYAKLRLVADVRKAPANFRWLTTPISTIEMRFLKALLDPLQICLRRPTGEWLTDFEVILICKNPIKTDPILNNYLTQTMDNNAHSGLKCIACLCFFFQIEKSFSVSHNLTVGRKLRFQIPPSQEKNTEINHVTDALRVNNYLSCDQAIFFLKGEGKK